MEIYIRYFIMTENHFLLFFRQLGEIILQTNRQIHLSSTPCSIRHKPNKFLIKIIASISSHSASHALALLVHGIHIKTHTFVQKTKTLTSSNLLQVSIGERNRVIANMIRGISRHVIGEIQFLILHLFGCINLSLEISLIIHCVLELLHATLGQFLREYYRRFTYLAGITTRPLGSILRSSIVDT